MADIVLIHGAWAGSWVWDSLLDGLHSAGHKHHAVDLPGNGSDATPLAEVSLERYVEHVGALIETLDGPVHLVGHSGGGVTATALAERYAERIAGVAYVAGMMLPSGMRFAELCAELSRDFPEVSGIGPYLQPAVGGSRVPGDAACAVFFHDAPASAAVRAARRLTVQPDGGRDIAAHWTAGRFGRLPRLYLEAAQDRSVLPLVQQRMQQLVPGAERTVLDCGHAPQLAAPEALLAALLDFFAHHPNPVL
ncbi:alpha/beta fold hydrolase [Pseudomonas sp. IC_126]|uniref:alpha/beta fold hydrolase n=1 Tax=Pseudomonas sp. IC_126 TaxID=2547400 RepID=UPI00103E5082|nr:alpha/beta fold hydrolase [Pseudomonas sp. IC_126]TCD19970.1 alpha/beta fold hydrolase [Pseudomonas sp. IC_126]